MVHEGGHEDAIDPRCRAVDMKHDRCALAADHEGEHAVAPTELARDLAAARAALSACESEYRKLRISSEAYGNLHSTALTDARAEIERLTQIMRETTVGDMAYVLKRAEKAEADLAAELRRKDDLAATIIATLRDDLADARAEIVEAHHEHGRDGQYIVYLQREHAKELASLRAQSATATRLAEASVQLCDCYDSDDDPCNASVAWDREVEAYRAARTGTPEPGKEST